MFGLETFCEQIDHLLWVDVHVSEGEFGKARVVEDQAWEQVVFGP